MKITEQDYKGPWVQIGIDTPMAFKERKVIFQFESYEIIWFNGDKEHYPCIAIPMKNPNDYSKEVEVGSRFLSVLAYTYKTPVRRIGGYGAGKGTRYFPRKLGDHIFPAPDMSFLCLPRSEKKRKALALYREGLDSNSPFYAFLSLYKIFEVHFGNDTQGIKNWINGNIDKVRDAIALSRLEEIKKDNADVGEYIYKSGRCALAHAQHEASIDPDEMEDYTQIWQDRWLLQDLAKIFIDSRVFD